MNALISDSFPADLCRIVNKYSTKFNGERSWNKNCENGNLRMVKFLHFNRTEGCVKYAMNESAMNGHLEVVKWLHFNRQEGCTSTAMD